MNFRYLSLNILKDYIDIKGVYVKYLPGSMAFSITSNRPVQGGGIKSGQFGLHNQTGNDIFNCYNIIRVGEQLKPLDHFLSVDTFIEFIYQMVPLDTLVLMISYLVI